MNGYVCNCGQGKSKLKPGAKSLPKYTLTKIDSNQCCTYCGHYAVFTRVERPDTLLHRKSLVEGEVSVEWTPSPLAIEFSGASSW